MSREDDALGGPYYAPTAFTKIRAKRAELDGSVAAGTITREDAGAQLTEFKSLQIAHTRERGLEPRT